MNIKPLAENLLLLTGCPHPGRHQEICGELADEGIRSLLVIGDDPTPCAMGRAGGLWCYMLPLVDPDKPSAFERQCVCDFVNYEQSHGRVVGIWVANQTARSIVCEAAQEPPPSLAQKIPPSKDNSICCRTYHLAGCDGRLLCHAAPLDAAEKILQAGRILSKHALTGKPLEQLAAEGTWGDPPDYFDYVNLARGNCVAPDIVAISRQLGQDLSPQEADEQFYPGVRFFFDTRRVFGHPWAEWDGIHPVKIQEYLELDPYLHAIVAPSAHPDGAQLTLEAPEHLRPKIIYLNHHEHFGLSVWSNAAFRAALCVQALQNDKGRVGHIPPDVT